MKFEKITVFDIYGTSSCEIYLRLDRVDYFRFENGSWEIMINGKNTGFFVREEMVRAIISHN